MPGRIRPRNIADLFREAAVRYGDAPAFGAREKKGEVAFLSFRQLYERGLNLATGLIDLGVDARDHVAILADNRLEWILADCAIQLCGAADVPRGTDITEEEIPYILGHSDSKIAFVEHAAMLARLQRSGFTGLRAVILMDPLAEPAPSALRLADVEARGKEMREAGDRRAEDRIVGIRHDDLFTLIYTSGTTGIPKGVMLTHANMVSQIRNLPFPLSQRDRTLSILPIWHSYERVFEMVIISWGASCYYTSLRSIADDLRSVKPTMMASAPRLWENLYLKIFANVEKASALKQKLFKLAYTSAVRVHRAQRFFMGQQLDLSGRGFQESLCLALAHVANILAFWIPLRILDPIILKKLRDVVGGEFRGTISGGGALQPHVDEFFNFIGIPVLEGYGLTETAPVLAVRTWKNLVIGTVGPPYPETEIRIVDLQSGAILYPDPSRADLGRGRRGEIHAKGPQIMSGYYKDPDSTARVLKDGWLNTGDIGMITFNDCLKILGRSKDTLVLLSGENVEPLPIENRLTQSPLIDQCVVVGQDRKFLSALIVPNLDAFRDAGLSFSCLDEASANPEARALLDSEIRRQVSSENGFKPFERIGGWGMLSKPFEVGDELTSTLKLRRHVIAERYADRIRQIYD